MKMTSRQAALKDLQVLPGVGPSIAKDLYALGMRSVRDLRTQDPERLYARLCARTGTRVDRCVLYTFRCAVYVSRTARPKPDRTLWWNWKERSLPRLRSARGRRSVG